MFKKSGNKGQADPLADRMRKISAVHDEEHDYSGDHEASGRAQREATFKQGTITTRGGERVAVVIKNVSKTGVRIEFFRDVELGDHVLITEPTLRLNIWAEVMWTSRGAAGLKFVPT